MKENNITPEQSYHYLSAELANGARLLGIDINVNDFATQALWTFQKMSKFKLYELMQAYTGLSESLREYNMRGAERIFAKCGLLRLREIDHQKNPNILFTSHGVPDNPVSPYMLQLSHLVGESEIHEMPVMMVNTINVASFVFGEPEIITNPENPFFSFPSAPYLTHLGMNALGVIRSAQPTVNSGLIDY